MATGRFAAFVITYKRPDILPDTVNKLFQQTLPPEKVLIIDNGDDEETMLKMTNFHPKVVYYRMGFNSGPAGGAKAGLDILAKEGYKWIYWGDDNDPPPTDDCFEKLIALAESYNGKCGQVGIVGHRFNRFTSVFHRTSNKELRKSEYIKVDSIGGNQCKIINGLAVNKGVFPEERLFFGFEDLDFDLALKKAGYEILVHSELFLTSRKIYGRMNVQRIIGRKKKPTSLWRDYYSIRNMPHIMLKNGYYIGFVSSIFIAVIKTFISFRHGFSYGNKVSAYNFRALRDFALSRYNQTVR